MIEWAIFYVCSSLFIAKRLLIYLRYLQQEDYQSNRFLHWIWKERAFDKRGSIVLFLGFLFAFFNENLALIFASISLFVFFLLENDPRKVGKLRLRMTDRARRIYTLALLLFLLSEVSFFLLKDLFWAAAIVLFQVTPLFLILSLVFLSTQEKKRQNRYISEGNDKLKRVSPLIIGITGSYGKTSTKDALGNLLQVTLGSTFWPKKGVNTEMGITREIRERLERGFSFAVIEMGAYHLGSIERLCQLTPPKAGIITCIGVAHLDRFKDQNTILKAKSELAKAIPYEGILVCNGDNSGCRTIARTYPKKTTLLYGFENHQSDLDCWIKNFSLGHDGMKFTFLWKEELFQGTTKLLGKASLSNLAASFSMACALGANPRFVVGAIANLKPVENRLQIQREKETIYLKDAYNSNPEGFSSALDVLSAIKATQKVLMTPGMIELAHLEKEVHQNIGQKASKICDKVIIVGNTNREQLSKGLILGGMPKENLFFAKGREDAFEILQKLLIPGSVVLIENDLPDLYERGEQF